MSRVRSKACPRRSASLSAATAIALAAGSAAAQYTSLSTVASNGYASGDVNSCAVGINTLTSVGNYQFSTYYNNIGHVMVGRRTLGSTSWSTFDTGYTG